MRPQVRGGALFPPSRDREAQHRQCLAAGLGRSWKSAFTGSHLLLQIHQQLVEIQESHVPLNHEQKGSSIQDEILPASFGGTTASSNGANLQGLVFPSIAQNHVLFHSLLEAARHSYQIPTAAAIIAHQISTVVATQLTQQQHPLILTTSVIDSSSRTLNIIQPPPSGAPRLSRWPASIALTTHSVAIRVFEEMIVNSLIAGFVHVKDHGSALRIFRSVVMAEELQGQGLKPNPFSSIVVLSCSHGGLIDIGFERNPFLLPKLVINHLGKSRSIDLVIQIFGKMTKPDSSIAVIFNNLVNRLYKVAEEKGESKLIVYSSMLAGLCKNDKLDKTVALGAAIQISILSGEGGNETKVIIPRLTSQLTNKLFFVDGKTDTKQQEARVSTKGRSKALMQLMSNFLDMRQRRKVFDPGGLIIVATSILLLTTCLDGVEHF